MCIRDRSTSASVVRGVGLTPFIVGAAGSAAVGGAGLMAAFTLSLALPAVRGKSKEREKEGQGGLTS